jgi:hypothetical protein
MASTLRYFKGSDVVQRHFGSLSGTYTAATDVNASSGAGSPASISVPNGTLGQGSSGANLAAGVLTITPGFIPNHVKVVNVTTRVMQEWFKGMNQGDSVDTAAAGTRTLETDDMLVVNETTGVVTVTASGTFTDNETVAWELLG